MSETNKATVRRYLEGLSRGDLGIIDELVSPDFVPHNPEGFGSPPGPEGQKLLVGNLRKGFPDLVFNVEVMIAEGDQVAVRWRAEGTHLGEWRGILPTAKAVSFTTFVFYRVSEGKIMELWSTVDNTPVLRQLQGSS